MKEEEELVLPLCQMANGGEQLSDVVLLPPPHDRRGVFSRGREVATVAGTRDFDLAFRAAAHRADRAVEGRTVAAGPANSAGWAERVFSLA